MKEKLQVSSATLVQYDEELSDLHGRGVLDGFDLALFGFQTNRYQGKNISLIFKHKLRNKWHHKFLR